MSYEFDEISFLKDEGADWWETIMKVPIKILDQDFGVEVQMLDLIASNAGEKTLDLIASSPPQQVASESESRKVLDLDSFKLKEDIDKKEGYSKVSFEKDSFKVEIFSTQFKEQDFKKATIEKGFLVITAHSKQMEGDATVWRQFKRRYMLPHDCNVSDALKQVIVEKSEGGMNVEVFKKVEDRKSPQKHSPLKSPGISGRNSTSPHKSPKPKEGKSPIRVESSPTRPKERELFEIPAPPPKVKEGMSTLQSPNEKQGKSPSPLGSPRKDNEASQEIVRCN